MTRKNELLNPPSAAVYLAVAISSLAKWRVTGEGPPFIKIGSSVRYRTADLETWIEGRRVFSTAEADILRRAGDSDA